MARTGKIASLPHVLRKEINRRLLDGEKSPSILAWLNSEPEAVRIWEAHFEGLPASAENISQWRLGGYKDWIEQERKTEHLKTLTEYAVKSAKAGHGLADGAASIVAGHIVEALETCGNLLVTGGSKDSEKDPLEGLAKVAGAVASLQRAGTAKGKLELDKKKVRQKDQQLALDREKFEVTCVAKIVEWAQTPEAVAILNSGKPKQIIMEDLRAAIFGPTKSKE